MSRPQQHWTEKESEYAKYMVGEGATYLDVAVELGRSVASVQRHAAREGFSRNNRWNSIPLTAEQLDQLRQMHADATPYKVISEVLGLTKGQIEWNLQKIRRNETEQAPINYKNYRAELQDKSREFLMALCRAHPDEARKQPWWRAA